MSKVGFIGTGNMASAIASAAERAVGGENLLLYNRTVEKAEILAKELGAVCVSMEYAAAESNVLFLGVTPQGLDAVLGQLAPLLAARETKPLVCSMAAGQTLDRLSDALPGIPLIRFMPNTPIGIGEGMTLYAPAADVSEEQEQLFRRLLAPSSRLLRLKEEQIDPVTCVTGCSIAYTYSYIEALSRHAEHYGVDEMEAFAIAAKAVAGAAELALASGLNPQTLRDQVCTPGGTSIEGVKYLHNNGLMELVDEACEASLRRCMELKK